MENAAEALKMAGAVLLFVLALSIIIFYFGQVRESADTIMNYRDRETTAYYYETVTVDHARTVNLETILPSVFRAYLENYKIVFDGIDKPIYKIKSSNTATGTGLVNKYTLDLETNQGQKYKNAVLANDEQKAKFIKGVFYGGLTDDDQKALGVVIDGTCEPLYTQLNRKINGNKVIREYLGIYYQTDNENEPDVNKTKKRVITYKIEDV